MIKLMTLLTECFYTSQWLDVLQKYPQIIDLLKNDAEINRHNSLFGFKIKNWDDMDEISSSIAHLGGYCGLDADSNFNLKDIKSFILDDMTDRDGFPITKETAKKLFNIVKDYFSKSLNTQDWISIEYNRGLKNSR
jgi:hypothetical protein